MSLPTRSPGGRPQRGQDDPSSDGSPQNLVRRMLHRKDPSEPPSLNSSGSPKAASSSAPSIVERLEGFFTRDLPSSMEVLPTEAQEPAPLARRNRSEQPTRKPVEPKRMAKDSAGMPSEFVVVRSIRLAAKDAIARTQDAYREIEADLKNHAQEFERRHEALVSAVEGTSAKINQLSGKVTKEVAEELEKASHALLSRSSQQFGEQADAAVAALSEKLSAERQRFVSETEKQFEELRDSRQSFISDAQKELAGATQASLELLTKSALEKGRAEFDAVQASLESIMKAAVEKTRAELNESKEGFVAESQKELASLSRSSVDTLSNDLVRAVIDQFHANVAGSRQAFIEETQSQLAQMTQAWLQDLESRARTSLDQAQAAIIASDRRFVEETPKQVAAMTQASLESLVKASVEQGRAELGHMVDEFLARGVPQIETELRTLLSRHTEAARSQFAQAVREQATVAARESISDFSRPADVHPAASPGSLEFRLAARAPKPRVELRDVWAGLASGVKFGLAAVLIVLFLFAIYVSVSPVVRLRTRPPAAFFDDSPSWTAKQRAREEQLARSYWDIAVRDVEGKYAFGMNLPVDPPDNFAVEERALSGAAPKVDAAARARYWAKLREVWPQADSWERTSDWNLEWIRNGWNAASAKLSQVFGSSRTSAAPAP
jgi:hypothetical protein